MQKTEKQKMLDGELYTASDPELAGEHRVAMRLLWLLNTLDPDKLQEHRAILTKLLPNAASDAVITAPFFCDYGYNIYIGEGAFFNYDCVVLDVARVTIGRNCFFAPKVQLYTATHPTDAATRVSMLEFGEPITIGDDCWLGGGVVVCPGVTIGDRVVVGAGSVVVHDLPSDCVAVGNPARVVKRLKVEE